MAILLLPRPLVPIHQIQVFDWCWFSKKAIEKGLKVKPWVKTSLAPGSQVVTDYLEKAGLNKYLDELGLISLDMVATCMVIQVL